MRILRIQKNLTSLTGDLPCHLVHRQHLRVRRLPPLICSALLSVSILNLHEDERQKPENWIPIGWMPCFDDEKARTLRPGQGYESCNARKNRLFHDCFRHLLQNWDADTRNPQTIVWGDQKRRQTRFFLGGLMGDQPVNTKNIFAL